MNFVTLFSVDSTLWKNISTFADWLGRMEYENTNTHGECFLDGVIICLEKDYGKRCDPEKMKTLIMHEVHRNAEKYKHFHNGDAMKVICSAFEYLKFRTFTANIVDVVIPCAADALKINLFIYAPNGEKTILITHLCKSGSDIDVYLKYDRKGGTDHRADHYTPLVLKPGVLTTTFSANPPITAVMSTNTRHPDYVKTQEEIQDEQEEGESLWTIPPSLIPPTFEDIAIASGLPLDTLGNLNQHAAIQQSQQIRKSSYPGYTNHPATNPSVSNSFTSSQKTTPKKSSCPTTTHQTPTNPGVSNSFTSSPKSTTNPLFGPKSASLPDFRSFIPERKTPNASHLTASQTSNLDSESVITPISSSQESLCHHVDAEKIVHEIIAACEDDGKDFYFDEFGCVLENTTAKKAPLERAKKPVAACAEDIMTLEDFAGTTRDAVYLASLEESDVEIEGEMVGTAPTVQLYESGSEDGITEIPEKFRIKGRPRGDKYSKHFLDMKKFRGVEVEMVDNIPWEVDGIHIYKILCDRDEWIDKQKDGRWYKMNSTERKFFGGSRKIGRCQGSRICHNVHCSKLQTEGICNTAPNGFYPEDGMHVCRSCGYYAVQIFCGCVKVTEYNYDTNELTVWYQGDHICTLKPDIMTKRNFFESLPLSRNIRLTPQEIRDDCMRFYVGQGKILKAKEVAMAMNDTSRLEKMRYVTPGVQHTSNPEDIAVVFSLISDIKKQFDEYDKYLIYRIHCGKTSSGESYIFKTSKHHLETALKMDINQTPLNGKVSMLAYEKSYFDAMHRRVKGFKTLTLWVHHPGLRRMKRLASMEVERETAENVELFFTIFNDALREYTGDPHYVFNPAMFVSDEAGAIHQGMYRVFGDAFLEKISTCQWHFKRCAWWQIIHIDEDDRATFRYAVNGICKARTNHEYELLEGLLDDICQRNKIVRWWNWWKVRRYHLVPGLRGFGWTGTNWAELGQSKMKRKMRIGLMDAVIEDILTVFNEEAEWAAFVNNTGKSIGKGPTVLAKRLKERRELRAQAQSFIDAFRQGRLDADIVKHTDPDRYFIASKGAKHRVPRCFPQKNPTQDGKYVGKGKGHGKSSKAGKRGGGRGRDERISAEGAVMIIEDVPDETKCGRGRGRGRGGRGRGQRQITDYGADLTILEQAPKQTKHERGRRGRGGRGIGQHRATETLYVSDDDDMSILEDGPMPTQQKKGRAQVIEDSDNDDDGVIPQNERSHTARTICCGSARPKWGGQNQRTGNPVRRNPDREFRGRNRRLEEDMDQYSTDEELRPFDKKAPTNLQEKIKIAQNPPTYTFLKRAKWCNGCKMPFTEQFYTSPMNLVLRFTTIVEWYKDGEYHRSRGPQKAYYHARDLGCLRKTKELEMVCVKDLYIEEACFANLTPEHKTLLRKRRHWIPVRRNRANVLRR